MAFTQLSKALHVNLCKMISRPSLRRCLLVQASRTTSTTPGLGYGKPEAPLCVGPLMRVQVQVQADRRRCISFTAAARNKSSPDDRDKSVSRFQGGSPKPSTAQKGMQYHARCRSSSYFIQATSAALLRWNCLREVFWFCWLIFWYFVVKEAGRDFSYLIVVLVGLGVTGDPHFTWFPKHHIHTHEWINKWTLLQPAPFGVCGCVSLPPHTHTGGLLYVVFQELFSSSSPNKIYGKAFNKVKLDPEVRIGRTVEQSQTLLFYITGCH